MKKRRVAIVVFWIFWSLTFEYIFYGIGFQHGQKAFINRYHEAGLECDCRVIPVPNPNLVHIYDINPCTSTVK